MGHRNRQYIIQMNICRIKEDIAEMKSETNADRFLSRGPQLPIDELRYSRELDGHLELCLGLQGFEACARFPSNPRPRPSAQSLQVSRTEKAVEKALKSRARRA